MAGVQESDELMTTVLFKALVAWLAMALIAILNGVLRESVLAPLLGPQLAQPLSGVFLAVLVFFLAWLAVPRFGMLAPRGYWLVGGLWLLMTLLFEFGFGRLVAGKSWDELLAAYDITSGNLWPAVLVVIFMSPRLAARLRAHSRV